MTKRIYSVNFINTAITLANALGFNYDVYRRLTDLEDKNKKIQKDYIESHGINLNINDIRRR